MVSSELEVGRICEYLAWDSDFFGHRIARIKVNVLTPSTISQILSWSEANDIACLYLLADPTDRVTVNLAEDNRFRFVDIRVTLEREIGLNEENLGSPAIQIRRSVSSDIPFLCEIARGIYRDTRFYFDSHFSRENCESFYATWIDKSCNGYADIVLVAELEGMPVGYISCHRNDHGKGRIGLVGTSSNARGIGVAQSLIDCSLRWFRDNGANSVTVVTQGRNHKALRLYERKGFLTVSFQLWYHKWFE